MATDKDKKILASFLKSTGGFLGSTKTDIHAGAVRTHAPSLNFIFGNGWGLPKGYSLLLYGNPGGGKSLILRSMIGQLHMSDPDAIAIVFDTEMRWEGQVLVDFDTQMRPFGIDPDRLVIVANNHPAAIFDKIEKEVPALIQAGIKVGLIGIDSLVNIQGVRGSDDATIMTQQRGDHASTIQNGLKKIQPIIRNNKIALVLTTQVRDEQDPAELMKKKKIRPAASWAAKHFSEYCIYVENIDSQAGRATLTGETLQDLSMGVFKSAKEGERIGHRIRARMIRSAMGPKNRVSEFTLDYKNGIINTHEEVWQLGKGTGAVQQPNNRSYVFGDRKWSSKEDFLAALKSEPDLSESVLQEVHKRDLAGTFRGLSEGLEGSDDDVEESSDEEESSESSE